MSWRSLTAAFVCQLDTTTCCAYPSPWPSPRDQVAVASPAARCQQSGAPAGPLATYELMLPLMTMGVPEATAGSIGIGYDSAMDRTTVPREALCCSQSRKLSNTPRSTACRPQD